MGVDRGVRVPQAREPLGDGPHGERRRVHGGHLVPGQRRRDARVGPGPDGVRAGDGAVLRVLVVVDEDAVALLLPPAARGELRNPALDVASECQRGATDLGEGPATLDPDVDVDAAATRRLGPADEVDVHEGCLLYTS